MQSCPAEILELIVNSISCRRDEYRTGSSEELPNPHIQDLAACSASCRSFSSVARPYLFKFVQLSTSSRAQLLADFIRSEPQIAQWIKRLAIIVRRSIDTSRALLLWLAQSTARTLITQLTHVKAAEITVDIIQSTEDIDFNRDNLAQAWDCLLLLHSIPSLALRYCDIPSWDYVTKLMNHKTLTSFSFENNQILEDMTDSESMVPTMHLQHSLVHYSNLSWLRLSAGAYDAHKHFIERIACSNIIHLELTSDYDESYYYAEPLLEHAPRLRTLILRDCSWEIESFRLRTSPNLEYIAFHDVMGYYEPRWIGHIVLSLANPEQLQRLEIKGKLEETQSSAWKDLDNALCDSRFACKPGERRLDIAQSNHYPAYKKFPRRSLSQTEQLGWFRISWPLDPEYETTDSDVDSESAGIP